MTSPQALKIQPIISPKLSVNLSCWRVSQAPIVLTCLPNKTYSITYRCNGVWPPVFRLVHCGLFDKFYDLTGALTFAMPEPVVGLKGNQLYEIE